LGEQVSHTLKEIVMGLLQQLGSMIGGEDQVRNMASGQGNYSDPSSQDHQSFQNMVSQAQPGILSQIFSHVAQQTPPQEYANHVSPAAGGASPFGSLGSGGLSMIASALLGKLMSGGGYNASSLLSKIPGLRTTDPNQMDPNQVAAVARYTQQNHPDLFGQAAAQVGQQQPSLLHSFLGKAGLAVGAAALASHFIKMDRQ
jgi:hypothetical protein